MHNKQPVNMFFNMKDSLTVTHQLGERAQHNDNDDENTATSKYSCL